MSLRVLAGTLLAMSALFWFGVWTANLDNRKGVDPVEVVDPPPPSSSDLAAPAAPQESERGIDAPSTQASQGAASGHPPRAPGSLGSLNLLQASEEYHPTRERFLELAGAIYFALEASEDELDEAGDGPWQKFDLDTLRRELRPQSELEALWSQPDTQALWALHQEHYLAQANLLILLERVEHGATRDALERELETTRTRLDSLRLSIWNDPAYQALYLLSKELR